MDSFTVQALVATEDVRFYEHSGIDFRALMRAVIKRGFMRQAQAGGGSTITQQLAKQLYSAKAGSVAERLMQKPIEWVIAVLRLSIQCSRTEDGRQDLFRQRAQRPEHR